MKPHSNISIMQYAIWRLIFKWLPFVAGFIMMCHCILMLDGVHTTFVGFGAGISILWTIAFIAGSYTLQFCTLHRVFTLYCLLVTFCINYHAVVGFGKYFTITCCIDVIIGISLHIALLIKIHRHESIGEY